MDNDDTPVGRVLSRREVLALMGGSALLIACGPDVVSPSPSPTATAGATTAASSPTTAASPAGTTAVPACVVKPELTEGPFYVDEQLERSDIRPDPVTGTVSQGVPLALAFNVLRVGSGCASLAGAIVDVWHCDAAGVYSDVSGNSQKFLRGHQLTDANGRAEFTTIYPGWYQGRAVHIHFKIRSGNEEFVSQLFFDDALTDTVYQQQPYSQRGQRTIRNTNDGIFRQSGSQLTLAVTPSGNGYASTFDIGLAV